MKVEIKEQCTLPPRKVVITLTAREAHQLVSDFEQLEDCQCTDALKDLYDELVGPFQNRTSLRESEK